MYIDLSLDKWEYLTLETLLSVTPARAARTCLGPFGRCQKVLRGKCFSAEAISVTGYGIASPTSRLRLGARNDGICFGF